VEREQVSVQQRDFLQGVLFITDDEKLPQYIIYKDSNTPQSQIKKELKYVEARAKYGYPGGQFYTVQSKTWVDQDRMMDWVGWVWDPYTKGSHNDGQDTCLLMDEFSFHLMRYVCKIMNKCGSEVEFIPRGYKGCLQTLDKWINKPFKQYLRNEFEIWMVMNGSHNRSIRVDIYQWIALAWSKVTRETIVNACNGVGHTTRQVTWKTTNC
jgi:hypothetical protein